MLAAEENELLTRTGAGTPMGTLLRRYWLPAMLSTDLPTPDCTPVPLKLLGEALVAYRDTSGNVGILDAYCPHRGANLFWGRNEDNGLRCVYHGWKYDVTGQCVDMPSEPTESNFKTKVTTRAYPCEELGGVVWAYMGPAELKPQIPELEWTLVPENHRYVHKRIQHCNYLQNVEGEVDSAHVSFLHRSFKTRDLDVSGQSLIASTADASPCFSVREADHGLVVGARRELEDGSHYWRVTQFLMPSYTMIPSEPGGIINFTGAIPIDDENMWGYTIAWHPDRPLTKEEIAFIETWTGVYTELAPGSYESALNKSNNYGIDREKQRTENYTGIRGIREQDLPVQEDQWGPISDRTREHLGTTDLAVIATRRKLLRQVRDLQNGTEPLEPHNGAAYRVRSGAFLAPADAVWYDYPEAMKWMSVSR
jgi:phthalate 4,5-dioxygenase oxygenase subunit